MHVFAPSALLMLALLTLSGCTSMVTNNLGNNLSEAIMNQDDLQTVEAGAPAYLILIDSLIAGNPDDRQMLLAGSRLYSAYASVFVEDQERSQRMAKRALDYSQRALCARQATVCAQLDGPYQKYLPALQQVGKRDVELIYTHALAWALWTQSHSNDWNAIANLPKIEAMFERVTQLEPHYREGEPWLYLGIIRTLLPPAMGGRPEEGRKAFEQAIALSEGENLMAKVEYARRYARMTFDQPLHDRLLQEVLDAPLESPGRTLTNRLAKQEAQKLLDAAANYF